MILMSRASGTKGLGLVGSLETKVSKPVLVDFRACRQCSSTKLIPVWIDICSDLGSMESLLHRLD